MLSDRPVSTRTFIARVLIALLIVALALFLWRIADVLLLLFGATLVALLLRGAAGLISARTPLPERWALAATVALLLALAALAGGLFGARVSAQLGTLSQTLPEALDEARRWLEQRGWGRVLIDQAEGADLASAGGGVVAGVSGAVAAVLGALGDLVLILFAGVYLAAQPKLYTRGVLRLVPPGGRERAGALLRTAGSALRQWLLGQLISMATVGVLVGLGLWLLGVRSALALGLIAGLAEFVPIVGPILAAAPALLVAFGEGPTTALYVVLLYLGVQQFESYLLTPIVQRRLVDLPPVATLLAIAAFGLVFGPLGLLFATPLLVVVFVAVGMLYVEDALGEPAEVPGR